MWWNNSLFASTWMHLRKCHMCHIKQGCRIKLVEATGRIYERLIIASWRLPMHGQPQQEHDQQQQQQPKQQQQQQQLKKRM